LEHRTLVSQLEALVGCEQFVAAETHCAGVIPITDRNSNNSSNIINYKQLLIYFIYLHVYRELELWMQIRSTAWTLVQLLNLVAEEAFPIDVVAPWRDKQPLPGGLAAQWLRMEFAGLAFRDSLNRKSSIFTFPKQRGDPRLRV